MFYRADITDLYQHICNAELSVAGTSFKVKRTSMLRGASLDVSNDSSTLRHLLGLRRALKVGYLRM